MARHNLRVFLLLLILLVFLFYGVYLLTGLLRVFTPQSLVPLAIMLYTGTALNRARTVVSPPRFPIMREDFAEMGLPQFEEVSFLSRDGVELSGWYRASQNGAAVVLVHSLGSSRLQMRHFVRPLVGKGFGVLLFDLRGHARSGGSFSAFGWIEHMDLLGALDYLVHQGKLEPQRIGALGFSLGAQIAARAAAGGEFSAVWLDGLIPVVYEDHMAAGKRSVQQVLFSPWWWLAYRTQSWLTGVPEPAPLVEVIGMIRPRHLMVVAAGSDRLVALGQAFFEAAGEPKQFWHLEEIPFGTGILEKGDDYDLRLTGFFLKNLLRQPTA